MGEAESTRVRILQHAIIDRFYAQVAASQPKARPCPIYTQPIVQNPTAPNQLTHTLNKATACPTSYTNPPSVFECQPVYTKQSPTTPPPGAEPLQGPAIPVVSRKFSRIGGIDQICRFPIDRSSSGRTAKLRTGIEVRNPTRYPLSVIPRIQYPAYIPPAPNTGVPIAPNTACGSRGSNPRA